MMHSGGYARSSRIGVLEMAPWVLAIAVFFLLPEYLSLAARIVIFILFTLSLDLILGYAGVITLGHSVFLGLGAYTAGILSVKLGINDPFLQLLAGAAMGAGFGILTGAVVLRTKHLTQLMLTLAIAAIMMEIGNKANWLTGGADGLPGVQVNPLFGVFEFDLFGKTGYVYCLVVLFIVWFFVRRLIYSPFGAMLTGIRENTARMHALGAPVYHRLMIVYTISAAIAGVAGVLLTQTTQSVGLNVLSFEIAGDVLIMLILGGVGRLYGAFVGPIVYLIAHDELAKQWPEYWSFGVGILLILVVFFARGGILGLVDAIAAKVRKP